MPHPGGRARSLESAPARIPAAGIVAVLALVACARGALAAGDPPVVYRWVDEHGVAHYTASLDRVPSSVRDLVDEVRPTVAAPGAAFATENASPQEPAPAVGAAPAAASAPTAGPASSAEPGPAETVPGETAGFRESERPSTDARLATVAPEVGAAAPVSAPPGAGALEVDARIVALEQEIARDEAALEALLSEPLAEGAAPLAERPEFREIAMRLPKLQADLRALREQRPSPPEP